MGIDPRHDLRMLMLSHLYHHHADGRGYFRGSDIIVAEEYHRVSAGLTGALPGAVPSRWPAWSEPRRVQLTGPSDGVVGPDPSLTPDGAGFAVPTQGHMPGQPVFGGPRPQVTCFLAAGATCDVQLPKECIADGTVSEPSTSPWTPSTGSHASRAPNPPSCCPPATPG